MSRDKVDITLMGGLGNQLFQVAFGMFVEVIGMKLVTFNNLNGSMRMSPDGNPEVAGFKSTLRFDVTPPRFLDSMLGKCLGLVTRISLDPMQTHRKNVIKFMAVCLSHFLGALKYKSIVRVFVSPEIGFTNWIPSKSDQLCSGYFQTYRFANNPKVKEFLMQLKPAIKEETIEYYRSLARIEMPLLVHIRLGDYKNEEQFGIVSTSYYFSAIRAQIEEGKFEKIWVFSDEISEYQKYIPEEYLGIVRLIPSVGTRTVSLFEVMRMCQGYVIANSTLSWWAAFLSYNQEAKVYYPDPWFAQLNPPRDLFPTAWFALSRE
jgi:hypothetical protein